MGHWLYWIVDYGLFFKKKIKCVGYDINHEKVPKINSGVLPLADIKNWFGF